MRRMQLEQVDSGTVFTSCRLGRFLRRFRQLFQPSYCYDKAEFNCTFIAPDFSASYDISPDFINREFKKIAVLIVCRACHGAGEFEAAH